MAGGKIGVVPGRILHMWHGDPEDRAYGERLRQFRQLGFNPDAHLQHSEGGMLEWSDAAPAHIKKWCEDMFHGRNEDGERKGAPDAAAQQARRPAAASR